MQTQKFLAAQSKPLGFFAACLSWLVVGIISAAWSQIIVSSNSLSFATNQWGSSAQQTFTVSLPSNTPPHSFWVLTSNAWLSVSPGSDTSLDNDRTVTVTFVTGNLNPGTNVSEIMVVSPLQPNSPVIIPVTCIVAAATAIGMRIAPGAEGSMGRTINIPLHLISTGDIHAVQFSLSYNKDIFKSPVCAVGSNAAGAYLITNATQASSYGRLGITISANDTNTITNAFATFSAGTQEIAVVSFTLEAGKGPGPQLISFTTNPVILQMTDTNTTMIAGPSWANGNVLLTGGYEADVAPRQIGNNTNTVADWVQVGRFVAGLDTATRYTPSEFQRADCAPRGTLGDGYISVIDWAQAGRYLLGLDAQTTAGGPTNSFPGEQPRTLARRAQAGTATRAIRIAESAIPRGETNYVDIQLISPSGTENAAGFTVQFDPNVITFINAVAGADALSATILFNADHIPEGLLGFAIAKATNQKFARGTNHLIRVYFAAALGAPADAAQITFCDRPILCEVCNTTAATLETDFSGAEIAIIGAPRAPASFSASKGVYLDKILLQWDEAAGATLGYEVWRNTAPDAATAVLLATPSVNYYADITALPGQTYYYAVRARNRSGYSDFAVPDNGWRRFAAVPTRAAWDFDGDGKADAYAYDHASGTWTFWLSSLGYQQRQAQLGGPGSVPVPADYDGDGRIDPAVYAAASGQWRILYSSLGFAERTFALGGNGFAPVPADYDGDGKADFAVYAAGLWRVCRSAHNYNEISGNYGGAAYLPAAADFDGDGKADPTLYDGANAVMHVVCSGNGYASEQRVALGAANAGGIPVPADYDNDGRADPAVYQASDGMWYIRPSAYGYQLVSFNLGGPSYLPLPADFDGDGRIDPAVYHDAGLGAEDEGNAHTWLVRLSRNNYSITSY